MLRIITSIGVVSLLWVAFAGIGRADDSDKSSGIAIGAKAANFTLSDQNGKDVSLNDFSGKVVVLEWTNPNCPFVQGVYKQKIMQTLDGQYGSKGVAWVAINSTAGATNDFNKQWAGAQGIAYPILNDVNTSVGKAFHATNTPEMYILSGDGTLLYKGAITNDPDGDKSDGKVNYVSQALDEILAGKPVSTPETKPWGCGVHYRD